MCMPYKYRKSSKYTHTHEQQPIFAQLIEMLRTKTNALASCRAALWSAGHNNDANTAQQPGSHFASISP